MLKIAPHRFSDPVFSQRILYLQRLGIHMDNYKILLQFIYVLSDICYLYNVSNKYKGKQFNLART